MGMISAARLPDPEMGDEMKLFLANLDKSVNKLRKVVPKEFNRQLEMAINSTTSMTLEALYSEMPEKNRKLRTVRDIKILDYNISNLEESFKLTHENRNLKKDSDQLKAYKKHFYLTMGSVALITAAGTYCLLQLTKKN